MGHLSEYGGGFPKLTMPFGSPQLGILFFGVYIGVPVMTCSKVLGKHFRTTGESQCPMPNEKLAHMYYGPNSLKGGYIGDYIGEYYRSYKGGY